MKYRAKHSQQFSSSTDHGRANGKKGNTPLEKVKENKLGTMPMGRLLISMSAPLMVSMIIQALYNTVDGIYLGRLSQDALTATSLSSPMQMLVIGFAVGTAVGVNSLVARRLGEKNHEEVKKAAAHGIALTVITYLFFLAFSFVGIRWFFSMFTKNDVLAGLGYDYLSICMRYSIGVFIAIVGERLLQATGKTTLSMIAQMSGALTNIILDPIFIFGKFGIPAMGITGAAVATVIGQWINGVVAVVLCLTLNKEVPLSFKGFRFSKRVCGEIYDVALPSIVMQCVGTFCSLMMNAILISYSEVAVAVIGVYQKLNSFVFMPVFGLTQALVPIVGFNYGARKKDRIRSAFKMSVIIALVIMCVGCAIFQVWPEMLLKMFSAQDEMMEMGVVAMRIISWSFISAAVAIVMTSVTTGLGVGYPSLICSLTRQIVGLVPAAYIFAKMFGIVGAFYAYPFGEYLSLVISIYFVVRVYRKKMAELQDNLTQKD